jgi:hypothetical protein
MASALWLSNKRLYCRAVAHTLQHLGFADYTHADNRHTEEKQPAAAGPASSHSVARVVAAAGEYPPSHRFDRIVLGVFEELHFLFAWRPCRTSDGAYSSCWWRCCARQTRSGSPT